MLVGAPVGSERCALRWHYSMCFGEVIFIITLGSYFLGTRLETFYRKTTELRSLPEMISRRDISSGTAPGRPRATPSDPRFS